MQTSATTLPFLIWLYRFGLIVMICLSLGGFQTESVYVDTNGGIASSELILGLPFSPYLMLQWKGSGQLGEIDWRLSYWTFNPFSVSILLSVGGLYLLLKSCSSKKRKPKTVVVKK